MNDIDFDELDRAIASAMQKDAAAAAPAAATDDKDEAASVAAESQPAMPPQPQSVVPLEPQPFTSSPEDVSQPAVVPPTAMEVPDVPTQASVEPVEAPVQDVDMTPQEAAIVHEVLQGIRETRQAQLQEAAAPATPPIAMSTPAEATVVDAHSPVPPLVLPKRSEIARRTPSAAVHARTMPGRSVSRMAEVTPPVAQAAAVVAAPAIEPVVPSAAPVPVLSTPVVELSSHDRHMAEVMTTELKKAAESPVVAATPEDTQESEQAAVKVAAPAKKPATPARATHLNPTARDTIRRAGRFMDMVHPSSDMRHVMAGAASVAPVVAAVDVEPDLEGDAAMPDRTEQTSDDKAVEDKVTDLLVGTTPEYDEVVADAVPQLGEEVVDTASDIKITAEAAIDEADEQAEIDTPTESAIESGVETMSQDVPIADSAVSHEDYHAPATVEPEAPASLQPAVEAQSATAAASKLDTEAHPIFDTDSYMQPVAAEASPHSNMVWKVLGVVLVLLLAVAAILLWQLSNI